MFMSVQIKQSGGFRTFYILILTQMLSLIGSRVSSLAVGVWIYSETGNATPLAMVSFFTAIPSVIAGTISGVLADRWDRRVVMALADAGQAVGTVLLLLSFVSGDFQLWHLYVVVLIQAIFGIFQSPAFNASITMLIPNDKRVRANALRQLTLPTAGVIAPVIATGIYVAVGVEGAIAIDLITFFVAMAVVLNVYIPRPEQTAVGRAMKGSIWKEAWGGVLYLWERKPLLYMMSYYAFANFFAGFAMILSIPYLIARIGDEGEMGVALSIINIGAIVGIIIIAYWNNVKNRVRLIVLVGIMKGTFLALGGVSQTTIILVLTQFLVLLPIPIGNSVFIAILQAKVPPDVQGRVFAVMGQLVRILLPIAYFCAGPLADNVLEPMVGTSSWDTFAPIFGNNAGAGMGVVYFVSGITLVGLAVGLYMIPSVRNVESILPDYVATPKEEPKPEPIVKEPAPKLEVVNFDSDTDTQTRKPIKI